MMALSCSPLVDAYQEFPDAIAFVEGPRQYTYRELYEAEPGSTLPAHHGNVTQMDAAFGLEDLEEEIAHLRDRLAALGT